MTLPSSSSTPVSAGSRDSPDESLPAHHRPGGKFENPWPHSKQGGFLRFLQWVIIKGGLTRLLRRPDFQLFQVVAPSFTSARAHRDALTITWVGHSSFLLQIGGANVLTDPIWSTHASPIPFLGPRRWVRPGIDFDALPPIDVVLVSHNHYDHLDVPTVQRLTSRFPDAHWIVPRGLASFFRARGVSHVVELDWWETTRAGTLEIGATPAQHFSARGVGDRNRTLWCGFAIQAGRRRALFAGDTGHHPEFARVAERFGPFDAVLLPIGAYEPRWFMRPVHMNPEDAVLAYAELLTGAPAERPPLFVPMHWGTFRLTDEPMMEPPERLRRAWDGAALPAADLAILRHGETTRLD